MTWQTSVGRTKEGNRRKDGTTRRLKHQVASPSFGCRVNWPDNEVGNIPHVHTTHLKLLKVGLRRGKTRREGENIPGGGMTLFAAD